MFFSSSTFEFCSLLIKFTYLFLKPKSLNLKPKTELSFSFCKSCSLVQSNKWKYVETLLKLYNVCCLIFSILSNCYVSLIYTSCLFDMVLSKFFRSFKIFNNFKVLANRRYLKIMKKVPLLHKKVKVLPILQETIAWYSL